MTPPILLAVPNVSEGRDASTIEALREAFGSAAERSPRSKELGGARGDPASGVRSSGVRILDLHSDGDHHRSVFTLAGRPRQLSDALLRGASVAIARIDVMARAGGGAAQAGAHPHVGAIDVIPLVYLNTRARGAACAEALVVADRIGGELEVPVFLYGELAGGRPGSTRAELRRGGVAGLAERLAAGAESTGGRRPDFGPQRMHPSAGATLVAAREPLVAFNVQLQAPASVADARGIAALIREGGADGLPGVRAIGVALDGGVAQVSMNVECPLEVPLADVVAALGRHASLASAELVGLAPRAALEGFPEDLPLPGFDPARHVIENALGS
jgi:glutamate formiminotransferase/glutamate formiminotransferase/formiminotetrahydrofolate cyclodeaminase